MSELRPDYQYLCQFSSTNGIHNFCRWMRFSHAIFNQSRCDTPLFESNGPSIFLQAIVLDNTQEALPSPATSLYNNRIVSERCGYAGCQQCLRQSVLSSTCLPRSSQCSAFYKCFQVTAGRRLRNTGKLPVHRIRNHALLSNVLHCLLHAPFLLEQQGFMSSALYVLAGSLCPIASHWMWRGEMEP